MDEVQTLENDLNYLKDRFKLRQMELINLINRVTHCEAMAGISQDTQEPAKHVEETPMNLLPKATTQLKSGSTAAQPDQHVSSVSSIPDTIDSDLPGVIAD